MSSSALALHGLPATRVTRRTPTFPCVALPAHPGSPPIEVSLVARLGHGAGTRLYHDVLARQSRHGRFVDALDEPSAKLGGTDFAHGDATALYSFSVGSGGHPFHRHAGHRVFTAVSGSSGAQLRFSTATPAELACDPAAFARALRHVDVPPDCLFTVRFSGETWHQFAPRQAGTSHPAFFALSTHTNELGGALSDTLRERVLAGKADIPSLTELLPAAVVELLARSPVAAGSVPTTALSLDDAPGGRLEAACRLFRSALGRARGALARLHTRPGFISELRPARVAEQHELPAHSLLRAELNDRRVHHQDRFVMTVAPAEAAANGPGTDAAGLLAALLASFLAHRHPGVTRLMALRNVVVRPLRLRTSPLACPVSSLLAESAPEMYAGRYPVHSSRVSADGRNAQVILGADDKHLVFRSCAEVSCLADGRIEFSLSTRVACKNLFGRLYMALISATHRRYIAPRLLELAVDSMPAR